MTSRTVTIYTCDRCLVENERTGADDYPEGWMSVSVRPLAPVKRDSEITTKQLCVGCAANVTFALDMVQDKAVAE